MRLVLSTDALKPPLTGIGYYALVVYQGLLESLDKDTVFAWNRGRLSPAQEVLEQSCLRLSQAENSVAGRRVLNLSHLGSLAARSDVIVKLYKLVTQTGARISLRAFESTDVYFSPNFLLVPFPGKTVVTLADFSTLRYPEYHPKARVRLVNSAIDYARKHADAVITLTEKMREEACEDHGFDHERVFVTPLAARSVFQPLARPDTATVLDEHGLEYKGYFLSTNTIEPRKNIEVALQAYVSYAEAVGKSNAMPLVLTGYSGWKNEQIFRRIQTLAGQLPVIYLGYVSDTVLSTLTAGALATIYLSIYEGFGLPILESMQAGTPVVCSNHGAMAEVGGAACLAVPAGDEEAVAAAMLSLQKSPDLAARLIVLGEKRAMSYTWQSTVKRTLDVLSMVSASARRP